MSQTNTNAAEVAAAVANEVAAAVPMPTTAAPAKTSWWKTTAKVVGYGTLAAAVIGGAAYAYTKYVGGTGGEG